MHPRSGQLIAPAIALVMLGVLAVQAAMRPTPEDTAPYHKLVESVYKDTPIKFGEWVGVQQITSGAAYRLLRPNVIFTRVFTNQRTGEDITFLLVHCKDARDIYGHYPPNCYPGQGWKFDRETDCPPFDWKVDDTLVSGTAYNFAMEQIDGRECIVYNFILLPNGQIARDMSQVSERAWDYMKRYYGAAQVQVVFGEPECRLDPERRREIFQEMVRAHMPIIKAILHGAQNDEQ